MYRILLAATIGLSLLSCESTTPVEESREEVMCICGTPEADLVGCYCELCVSGEGNPDNPLCTCSPLIIGGAAK